MKIMSLKNQKDFDEVFKKKNVFGNRHFTLFYSKNGKTFNRLGIIVSKKTSKKAVCRNRIRRQIKESFRLKQSQLKVGYDFIIIGKASCVTAPYKEMDRSMNHLFYKTHLQGEIGHDKKMLP